MISLKHNSLYQLRIDKVFEFILSILAIVSAAILVVVFCFLVQESIPAISDAGLFRFAFDETWHPGEGKYGMLPMLVASVLSMGGAIFLALPIGLACGIFEVFYASRVAALVFRLAMALLAGIPSVVYGLWGLTVLVPIISLYQPPGASLLAAILILFLMILPTVAISVSASLRSVNPAYALNATALGLTKSSTIYKVVVPSIKRGIVGGCLLAIARALGETMAVLMVAGNVSMFPQSIFDPVRVLTANIALEMAYATDIHRAGLFVSGLVLTALILFIAWISSRILLPEGRQ